MLLCNNNMNERVLNWTDTFSKLEYLKNKTKKTKSINFEKPQTRWSCLDFLRHDLVFKLWSHQQKHRINNYVQNDLVQL